MQCRRGLISVKGNSFAQEAVACRRLCVLISGDRGRKYTAEMLWAGRKMFRGSWLRGGCRVRNGEESRGP